MSQWIDSKTTTVNAIYPHRSPLSGKYKAYIAFALAIFVLISCTSADLGNAPVLTVHYHRFSHDYGNWDIWAWPSDPAGNGFGFSFDSLEPDADGFITARIFFDGMKPHTIKEIGVIARRAEGGNDWAEKDVEQDRFTDSDEIWLVQGDRTVYTQKPENKSPSILFAAADSQNSVVLSVPVEPKDYGTFAVYSGERKLSGISVKAPATNSLRAKGNFFRVLISLDESISDPSFLYTVKDESGFFSQTDLTMRDILDDFYYDGDDLGLSYTKTGSAFKVWAPSASSLFIALYDDPGVYNEAGIVESQETRNMIPMEKDFTTGVWSAFAEGNLEGKFYLYRAEFSNGTKTWAADPYAKAVSANGQRMAIINLADTNPEGWRQKPKPAFNAGSWQDAVIYELHVRDFSMDENSGMTNRGKFLAFTERGTINSDGIPTGLDHIAKLGVTHVHLLPTYDFGSINELTVDDPNSAQRKFNWGYDPVNFNVPEGSYSSDPKNPLARIVEFKQMVQAMHDAGIRVVLDQVFNHTYMSGHWPFDTLVPGYYYRVNDAGIYANGSQTGNEVASEKPMVRKFIIDSCLYWVNEYDIDGFRFDLMGLIDTPTMSLLTKEVRKADSSLLIYGEPWQAGGSILAEELQTVIGSQKGLGFAIFNDRIRTAIKGGSDDNSRGFATGEPLTEKGIVKGLAGSINDFTEQANESINYVTAHDNLNLWDKMAVSHGTPDIANLPYSLIGGESSDIFESMPVKSVLLSSGIIFTSQGIPFFQAGDEILRSKAGDHNSYMSSDEINKIRWENATLYRDIFNYHAGLISLRKEHVAFRQTLRADIENSLEILSAENGGVSFVLNGNTAGDTWDSIFVAYNGTMTQKEFTLPAGASLWYQVVNSRNAGTQTLGEFSDKVIIPPLSMTVMHN